ncbi:hypothetical protein [Sphingomonas sp.]|uniref:hypothetical protein n=1 Tax=Sphingomonas sp. TaxID=28214 RepID=UPI003B3A2795
MNLASLNLGEGTGHGVWSACVDVVGDDWAAAEADLAQQAKGYIDSDGSKPVGGYHVFRDHARKVMTLDLMRGG